MGCRRLIAGSGSRQTSVRPELWRVALPNSDRSLAYCSFEHAVIGDAVAVAVAGVFEMAAAGIKLHEADAGLEQPASDQTFAAKVGGEGAVEAVSRAGAGILAIDVDDFGGARLHAKRQFIRF